MSFLRKAQILIGKERDDGTVQVTTFDIDKFDIHFRIKKDGEAKISIFNLSPKSIDLFAAEARIVLRAGYEDDFGELFHGAVQEAVEERSEGDIRLDIYCSIETISWKDVAFTLEEKEVENKDLGQVVELVAKKFSLSIRRIDDAGDGIDFTSLEGDTELTIEEFFFPLKDQKYDYSIERNILYFWRRGPFADTSIKRQIDPSVVYFFRRKEAQLYEIAFPLFWSAREHDLVKFKGDIYNISSIEHNATDEEFDTILEISKAEVVPITEKIFTEAAGSNRRFFFSEGDF